MSKNTLAYFVLFNLIQFLLIEVNCQMAPFKPLPRYLHTATFINNKLYVLGGRYKTPDTIETVGKEFFYLDFSGSFNTAQELSWKDLSSNNIVPSHRGAAAVKGGADNNTLFLYGGKSASKEMSLVYTFDSKSDSWSIPNIAGDNAIKKGFSTAVIDSSGKMYMWGGQSVKRVNDMLILDTINLSFGIGSLVNAPTPRDGYGVVLLPNNNIIYMGGSDVFTSLALHEVYIYDTMNDNWSVQKTTGKAPTRSGFSAVLGLDGQRIIIFGGRFIPPEDALYVLDLTDYSWSIPKISGKLPGERFDHIANVIGKFMVISFGNRYNPSVESDILLLDISKNEEYEWTTQFDPSSLSVNGKEGNSNGGKSHKLAIIGAILGSLVGAGLLIVGAVFLYKRSKKNKQAQKDII